MRAQIMPIERIRCIYMGSKGCQHYNQQCFCGTASHTIPEVHALLASIITIVSPCCVNLEAATCTAFTYGTYKTMWDIHQVHLPYAQFRTYIVLFEHVIDVSQRAFGRPHEGVALHACICTNPWADGETGQSIHAEHSTLC